MPNLRTSLGFLTGLGLAALTACGSVEAPADDAGPDDDGDVPTIDGGPDGSPDAAPPRTARIFHLMPGMNASSPYVAGVKDGVVSTAVPLHPSPTNPTTSASLPRLAAGGTVAFYTADATTEGFADLYMVKLGAAGPAGPVKLNGAHGGGGYVLSFQFAPDGGSVIYAWGFLPVGGFFFTTLQYYFVDLSGQAPGTPVPLTGGNTLGAGVMSQSGNRFAFIENNAAYVVDVSGTTPSAPQKISGTILAGTTVSSPAINADGSRVAYVADATTDDVAELWVVNTAGATPGAPMKASSPLVAGGDVFSGFLGSSLHTFSPDGKKLAYLADGSTDGVIELYVTDVSGAAPGQAKKVNDALVSGGNVSDGSSGAIIFLPYGFSPDSQRLAYQADQRTDEVIELFVSDVSGATPLTPVRVSGALVSGGDVFRFVFAPDGSGLAYSADQRTDGVSELFYVNLRQAVPSASVVVNGPLVAGGAVATPSIFPIVAISDDGKRLAYAADEKVDTHVELFVSDVSTGTPTAPVRVQEVGSEANIFAAAFTPDGSAVVWTSNTASATYDIWLSDLSGPVPGQVQKVNVVPSVGGSVPSFVVAP